MISSHKKSHPRLGSKTYGNLLNMPHPPIKSKTSLTFWTMLTYVDHPDHPLKRKRFKTQRGQANQSTRLGPRWSSIVPYSHGEIAPRHALRCAPGWHSPVPQPVNHLKTEPRPVNATTCVHQCIWNLQCAEFGWIWAVPKRFKFLGVPLGSFRPNRSE